MRLSGKIAIVTGSGSGLGKATVMRMAREGASVVVNDINVENMESVVKAIKDEGGTAIGVKANVTNRSEVRDLMKATADKFGRIDILVNNAGITRHKLFAEMSDEDWDAVLAVDLKGVFNCCQAVASYMMKQQYGKIINIASAAGTGASPHIGNNFNYASAKAGVIQLTKSVARELGPYGINVNSVAPGHIPTPLSYASRTKEEEEEHVAFRKKGTVLGRVGVPEDIANAVLFLASDESSFIAGQLLIVDGGRIDRM
ncbi:SDR family NAD(P)-dependent oxidoreductase [Chloroflexota bacterium]